jgi:hypothetical protein
MTGVPAALDTEDTEDTEGNTVDRILFDLAALRVSP